MAHFSVCSRIETHLKKREDIIEPLVYRDRSWPHPLKSNLIGKLIGPYCTIDFSSRRNCGSLFTIPLATSGEWSKKKPKNIQHSVEDTSKETYFRMIRRIKYHLKEVKITILEIGNSYRLFIIALMSFFYDDTLTYLCSTQFPIYKVLNHIPNTDCVYYAMDKLE